MTQQFLSYTQTYGNEGMCVAKAYENAPNSTVCSAPTAQPLRWLSLEDWIKMTVWLHDEEIMASYIINESKSHKQNTEPGCQKKI